MLIPLHLRSSYSLGHGTASLGRIVERALENRLPALALTDIDNVYGQVTFHELCREAGIRPITGVELEIPGNHDPAGRLVLLARDRTGYENICRAITRRRLAPVPEAADPLDSLREGSEGLFILTDDLRALERLLEIPALNRDALRLLLVRPGRSLRSERKLFEASRARGIPLVADPAISFLDPVDRGFHALKLAIAGNSLISQVGERGLIEPVGRHFPGSEECERTFSDVPEAVRESRSIAEECDLDLRRTKPIFPRLELPDGRGAWSQLARIVLAAISRRFGEIPLRYRERARVELSVIRDLGFSEYFLLVGDIVRFARERGIEVVGRGSGAGSLVAHLLGLTNVDPIEHGLYFERFLHPGRTDLPDIDLDLCWIRRDEVIEYVYRAYGHHRVAMISSHNTFQPRSAFREAIKAFGVPIDLVNRYSKRFPEIHPEIVSEHPLRDLILSTPLSKSIPLDSEPFSTALPLAERLLNQPHYLSIHPGGIVVGDRSLEAYTALERAAKGIAVTQYDRYSIEKVGLVKLDLLGSRCLTELQETIDLARSGQGNDRGENAAPVSLAAIPDRDPRTLSTIEEARTIGCFQLESPAMRSLLSKIPVKGVRDCIAALAIIRPGAAALRAKETFIRRANGEEEPAYLHPSLEKVLGDSHGVVIFEEDVMCIASAITGTSLAEGDQLRSAMKRAGPEELKGLEREFLNASGKKGVPEAVGKAVWQELCRFAYCFAKAHAAGYGLLAYQSAYLKTHFPVEYACAILNNHAGAYSLRTIAEEVKRMGVKLLHPSIQRSLPRFTVEAIEGSVVLTAGMTVRTGLSRVKGLRQRSIASILEGRKRSAFRSLRDFLRRVAISRREVEALILAGAFDDLPPPPGGTPPNHPQLLWQLETAELPSTGEDGGQESLLELNEDGPAPPPLPPYGELVRIQNELNFLQLALTDHPLRILRGEARRQGLLSTREAAQEAGRNVAVAGLIAARREIRTAKGSVMQFVTLEDEFGLLECTLFPRAYSTHSVRLEALGPYVFHGRIETDRRAVNLNVSSIEDF